MDFFNLFIAVLAGVTPLGGAIVLYLNRLKSQLAETGKLYIDISKRWGDILPLIYDMRVNPPDVDELKRQKQDIFEFMADDTWKNHLRPICNFYSDVGFLVANRNIELRKVTTLVTISERDFMLIEPVIDWINQEYKNHGYRSDLYANWRDLVKRARDNQPKRFTHFYSGAHR